MPSYCAILEYPREYRVNALFSGNMFYQLLILGQGFGLPMTSAIVLLYGGGSVVVVIAFVAVIFTRVW